MNLALNKNTLFIAIIFFVFGCASQQPKPAASVQKKRSRTEQTTLSKSPASKADTLKSKKTDGSVASAVVQKNETPIVVEDITDEAKTVGPSAADGAAKPSISAAGAATEIAAFIPKGDVGVIGAVLPLTGKSSGIGQHALNAIRMGLGLDKADNKLRLALFDSQSNPELAAKGAKKLVLEDKVMALLGGFTAKEAAAIAEQAEMLKTPFIAFSQKSGLTSIGEHIFRNSLTPEMQVDKLVQFAFDKLSAKKFAVLYPNDTYGVEFSNIFWDHVLARGGEITAAQTYDPKETDFTDVVQKMIGTYYVEARAEEYAAKLKEIKANKEAALKQAQKKNQKPPTKKSSRDSWSEENILDPIADFDVLFIPDNSRALGKIMAFMKYNDVEKLNYLGTNIWNSPELPKRANDEKSSVYFVDALDVSTTAEAPSSFFKDYLALYGEEPSLVEIQAYESAKIIKDQLVSGSDSREDLADNLRSLGRREGVTGELRMSSQREIERPIHVLTLNSGLIKKTE